MAAPAINTLPIPPPIPGLSEPTSYPKTALLMQESCRKDKRCVCSCLRGTTLPLAWNQDRLPPLSDLSDDCHRTTIVQTQEKVQHLEAQSIKYKLKKLSRNMNIQISIIYTLVLLKNKYITQISPFRHRSRIYKVQVGGVPHSL